jgi:hypothetical protein
VHELFSKSGSSYTELVCEGDSTFDAIRKCGPPDYRGKLLKKPPANLLGPNLAAAYEDAEYPEAESRKILL